MQVFFILTWLSLLPTTLSAVFGFTQQDGRTRLVGSSFGLLGTNATFDYIIVGGGTSGLTVARRLAENPQLSVAVIEGGSFYEIDNGNVSQIPTYDVLYSSASPSTIQPLVDWGIVTVPQPQLDGREIHYTQGKCLGGSSARNYLAYQRGTLGSYQRWADIVEDQNYTFEKLLPYFQRSPTFTPPNYEKRGLDSLVSYNATAFSPSGGPLHVSYANYYAPFSKYIKQAFLNLGLKNIAGLNSGQLLGFSEFTITVDPSSGTRSSSETSFLQEAISSTTLLIYQQTLATKILFDTDRVATGVNVETAGRKYTLSAKREVILAAGVFRSPQILLLSGIGPAATLGRFEIPVVSNLQGVGQNLIDQPLYSASYRVNVTTKSQLTSNSSFAMQALEDYLTNQTGPLESPGGNWVGWEKLPQPYRSRLTSTALLDLSSFPADFPELELLPQPTTAAVTNDTDNYASIAIALLTTTSRGNVTINSTNTNDNPLVSTNWLLSDTDQELAVQGFRRAREIANATGIVIGPEYFPGPEIQTDEQILQYIRETVGPIHHACGTCAMGKAGDPGTVVDSHGKVIGVSGLRVVDISTFPLLPPGHPQASVYMLAEKHSDDILSGN